MVYLEQLVSCREGLLTQNDDAAAVITGGFDRRAGFERNIFWVRFAMTATALVSKFRRNNELTIEAYHFLETLSYVPWVI